MIYKNYNEKKAAQAAGLLLRNAGGEMDYYVLTKILYIAERESLRKWNKLMFGGNLVSMEHGPVHGSILDSARHKDSTSLYWVKHISVPQDNIIRLVDYSIEDDEMSNREIRLLNDLYEQFGNYSFKDMYKYVHEFPEHEDPGTTSIPINVEEILSQLGRSEEEIRSIEDHVHVMNQALSLSSK